MAARVTPTSKRTVLVQAIELARESAMKWANIHNSLGREKFDSHKRDALEMHKACKEVQARLEKDLAKIERNMERLAQRWQENVIEPRLAKAKARMEVKREQQQSKEQA